MATLPTSPSPVNQQPRPTVCTSDPATCLRNEIWHKTPALGLQCSRTSFEQDWQPSVCVCVGVRMDESHLPFALCSQINTGLLESRKDAVCVCMYRRAVVKHTCFKCYKEALKGGQIKRVCLFTFESNVFTLWSVCVCVVRLNQVFSLTLDIPGVHVLDTIGLEDCHRMLQIPPLDTVSSVTHACTYLPISSFSSLHRSEVKWGDEDGNRCGTNIPQFLALDCFD